jgi:xylulokinase
MSYCLSVDLGTTYVKAGVYDEQCTLHDHADTPADMDISKGYCIQYAEDFLKNLKSTLKKLSFDLRKIDVISFTGQMAGVVGVDKDFEAVTVWSGTVDTRSATIEIPDRELLLRVCGSSSPFMAQKILMFEKEVHAVKYIGLLSYVIGKLVGSNVDNAFFQETNLTWTGLSELRKRCWSKELITMFNLSPSLLPRIANSMEEVGKITSGMAAELGLCPGTPILAGIGDKIAGCLGSGCVNEGDLVDEHSSVPAISMSTRSFRPDIAHRTWEILPSIKPGYYYAIHYMPGTGIALNWFVNTFAQLEIQDGKDKNISAHTILEKSATSISAGCDSLLCVGLLGGRTLPYQPNIRGVFIGQKLSHTKPHFYRAFLESFAYEYKRCLDNLTELYPGVPASVIRSIGGGSKSALLSQIKSDVLNRTYRQMDRDDLTLLGCAIVGFAGIGVFQDPSTCIFTKTLKEYIPDSKNEVIYKKMASLYNAVIKSNEQIFDELASL